MKRHVCLVLGFAVLVTLGVGCRRREPQQPVLVLTEKDFIHGPGDPEIIAMLKPLPPKEPEPKLEDLVKGPELEAIKAAGKEAEALQKIIDAKDRLEKENATKKLLKNLEDMAAAHAAFFKKLQKKPQKPNEPEEYELKNFSLENFKTELRRTRQLTLRKLVDEKKLEVIFEVDPDVDGEFIVHTPGEEDDTLNPQLDKSGNVSYPTGFATVERGPKGTQIRFIKAKEHTPRVEKQRLWAVFKVYDLYRQKFDDLENRDLDHWKRFAKENAPPSLVDLVEAGQLKIKPPSAKGKTIACINKVDTEKKGHMAITNTGSVFYMSEDEAKVQFAAPPEQDKDKDKEKKQ